MPDSTPPTANAATPAPGGGRLALVIRVALAGLFILAGVLKLSNPQAFADAVLAFKIIPVPSGDKLVVLTTFIVPWTELIAGTCLLLGLWGRAAALVISLMLVVFTGGILSVMLRPDVDATCGCFGKLEFPCGNKVGVCQLIRDVVMLAGGLYLVAKGPGPLTITREK